MSIGNSGRIVLEIDPEMKRSLYAVLARDGLTLKAWFTQEATEYIENATQGQLFTRRDIKVDFECGSRKKASDVSA